MMKANKKVMAALLAAMMTVSAGAAVVSAADISAPAGPGGSITETPVATTGWFAKKQADGSYKYYYKVDKDHYATGWNFIDGSWYYFANDDGHSYDYVNGKVSKDSNIIKNYGIPYALVNTKTTGLYEGAFANSEFRFGKDGKMVTGWYQVSNSVDPVTGNANNWEYYNANGINQTGWFKVGANWFYITPDNMTIEFKENTYWVKQYLPKGTLLMNGTYKFPSGNIYTFAANGVLVNEGQGWVKDGGNWYYVLENGTRFKGVKTHGLLDATNDNSWKLINGKYYLFDEAGVMQTGWKEVIVGAENGQYITKWYYMTANGDCVMNNWVQNSRNGDWYLTNASGEMVTGWAVRAGKTYYLNGKDDHGNTIIANKPYGAMATGTVKIGNNTYTFDASGALVAVNGQTVNPGVIPQ